MSSVSSHDATMNIVMPTCGLASSMTFFLWDFLINASEEIHFILKRDTTVLTRVCLVWLRYSALACALYGTYSTQASSRLCVFGGADRYYRTGQLLVALEQRCLSR